MCPSHFRSNSVSENFVRINLKVKRYSRQPGRITGSRYKRLQWKQRQKRLSKDGQPGMSVCFKCGKLGHWARSCTEKGCYGNPGTLVGKEETEHGDNREGEEDINGSSLEELASSSPFLTVKEEAEISHKINARPSLETEVSKTVGEQFPASSVSGPEQISISSAAANGSNPAHHGSIEPYFSPQKGDVLEGMSLRVYFICTSYVPCALLS